MQDNFHVASLLGFTGRLNEDVPKIQPQKQPCSPDGLKLADILMKTLLRNLGYHTVSITMSTTVLPFTILFDIIRYSMQLDKDKKYPFFYNCQHLTQ